MSYAAGYSGDRMTLDALNKWTQWARLHPEVRSRLVALFDAAQAAGVDVGIGGGWRSSVQQEALFRSRYTSHGMLFQAGAVYWNNEWWTKNPGVAAAAPPGRSYHESTVDGYALAADLIGDLPWMNAHAAEFELRHFALLSEPWHVQPVEVPNARLTFNADPSMYPLRIWQPPPEPIVDPAPIPAVEEDDMVELIRVQDDAAVLLRDGLQVTSIGAQVTVDSLIEDGIVARTEPRLVRRASLKGFVLRGPGPSYVGYTGSLPGRTKVSDFAAQV